jgi:hypothetical protein
MTGRQYSDQKAMPLSLLSGTGTSATAILSTMLMVI